MSSPLLLLALLGVVGSAAGACNPKGGVVSVSGCCECSVGYTGEDCTECAHGFASDGYGRCGNGRAAMPCEDDAQYPFWGCAEGGAPLGMCTVVEGKSVFPCYCTGQSCDTKQREVREAGGCYPDGARVYSTFPNEPLMGKPFDLVMVGCHLSQNDKFLMLPQDRTCAAQPDDFGSCEFDAEDVAAAAIGPNCITGAVFKGMKQGNAADAARSGMTEATFKAITVNDAGMFRICEWTHAGWKDVEGHDAFGRDETFSVCSGMSCDATIQSIGEDNKVKCPCEDGLTLGAACIHWAIVFVLFLLVLGMLAGVLYRRSKLKAELDIVQGKGQ